MKTRTFQGQAAIDFLREEGFPGLDSLINAPGFDPDSLVVNAMDEAASEDGPQHEPEVQSILSTPSGTHWGPLSNEDFQRLTAGIAAENTRPRGRVSRPVDIDHMANTGEIRYIEEPGSVLPNPEVVSDLDARIDNLVVEPVKGVNPKDAIGAKKVDLSLVPSSATLHMASAMMDGAQKYGPYNWRENPVQGRVYLAAALRHIAQKLDGEDTDPISGVDHAGHAMACLAIYLDAQETGNLVDDRPIPGAASDMIRRFDPETKFD